METTAHFENIPQEIARWLAAATREIVVAVAWFTDRTLFEELCRQAGRGLTVRLAVLNDSINIGPGRLNFPRLRDMGGDVFVIPSSGMRDAIMHHKFCVIDGETVITGSYNWTRRAQDNDENITVIRGDTELALQYCDVFERLLAKYGFSALVIDTAQVRRRLEVVRNLLLLEDWDAVTPQLDKLRPARATLKLDPLFVALDARDSAEAVSWIEEYQKRSAAIALATDQEIAFLRLELRSLEYQVTALSDEKAEIERLIHAFSIRSAHALGDLLTRYLKLQAAKVRRDAANGNRSAEEAETAEQDYEQYRDANRKVREKPAPWRLSPDDTRELKRLYRQASQKCHPDKVEETDRGHAEQLFVQLQAAYQRNDLAGVRAIHAAVREGHLFIDRSTVLTESESLGHAIAVLRRDVEQLGAQIHQLRQADAYRTSRDLDDWDAYFAEQQVALEVAIAALEEELAGCEATI